MNEYRGELHDLRKPCVKCGGAQGRITTAGGQDCVYCLCGEFQYNAPKTETGRKQRSVSTVHEALRSKDRARILMRANGRCEMCGCRRDLTAGHLLSVVRGLELGMTDAQINSDENLAAMCPECNLGVGREPVPARFVMALVLARIAESQQTEKVES